LLIRLVFISLNDFFSRTAIAIGIPLVLTLRKAPRKIINSGADDLTYYVIADNPIGEAGYYPDSDKWKVNKSSAADRVVIKGDETDYFDGEE